MFGQRNCENIAEKFRLGFTVSTQYIKIKRTVCPKSNFKSHHIIMSARVYFKKRVKDCKNVSIMSPQDEQ